MQDNVFRSNRTSLPMLLALLPVVVLGCAKAQVTQTRMAGPELPKPDLVIVHDLAVTGAEVKLDQGLAKTLARGDHQAEEEIKIGQLVADSLSKHLVEELNKAGIRAVRADASTRPTPLTMEIKGSFVKIDQGNATERNLIGLGLGNGKVETLVQAYQNGVLEAQAITSTRGSLKPGMLTSGGASAAAGTITAATVVIGGVTTVVSNELLATVEADAKRTAGELSKRIVKAYQQRGWMASGE